MLASAVLAGVASIIVLAGISTAQPPVQTRISGNYGFYVNGINARPLPFAEIGQFTADSNGGVSGNVTVQTSLGAGLLASTSASSFSGTYVVNPDGTGTMTLTIGAFHFVIDDNGDEIRLIQDLFASKGIARRQSGPINAFAKGQVPGYLRTNSLQCSGLYTPLPAADFHFGVPLEVQAASTNGNGTVDSSGFLSFNGLAFPFTLSGTIAYNPDGTFEGDNGGQAFVGVLTAPGQDYFAMGIHPETVETCILHQQ
jgi:hypothetical protein